jgi:hypothetical protein
VHFTLYDEGEEAHAPLSSSCLFKGAGNEWQDALMIQFLDFFETIFREAGHPYIYSGCPGWVTPCRKEPAAAHSRPRDVREDSCSEARRLVLELEDVSRPNGRVGAVGRVNEKLANELLTAAAVT